MKKKNKKKEKLNYLESKMEKHKSKCKFCGKEEIEISRRRIEDFTEKICECGNNKFWIEEVLA